VRIKQALAAAAIGAAVATGNSHTVSVGGSAAPASHPFTASTVGAIVQWKVPTLTLSCTAGRVPDSPLSTIASGANVTDVFTANRVSFTGCGHVLGLLAVTTVAPWTFHSTSVASDGVSDTVAGHIDGFNATWSNAVCKFTVSGTARASFDEAAQKLVIAETGFTGNLIVSNVTGCLGQITNGQPLDLTGTFNVASPDGLINFS
jgi:hypothetical protein